MCKNKNSAIRVPKQNKYFCRNRTSSLNSEVLCTPGNVIPEKFENSRLNSGAKIRGTLTYHSIYMREDTGLDKINSLMFKITYKK